MNLQGKRRAEVLSVSITGLVLLFLVLDTLSTNQNVPCILNGMLPKVKRENLYTAVSLLGANIMPHNFYLHSAIVREQKRTQKLPLGTLCHYNILEIAFAFSGILLVNLAVLSSAATTFHNAGLVVLTFQDAQLLMSQIFKSSIAPVAFFLALFCASQLSTLTGTIGGQIAMQGFLGVNPRAWLHRIVIKTVAIAPAMLCVWTSGTEGIYQLLIFSQVILALQLPSAVIPLFRTATASSIMGTHKISLFVEVLAWLSFFLMLILNISLLLDMFFGDSEWMGSVRWNMGTGVAIPFVMVLVVAFVSFGLMLWLIATPLRSANDKAEIQIRNQDQKMFYEHVDHVGPNETIRTDLKSEDFSSTLDETLGNKEAVKDEPLAYKNWKIGSEEPVQVRPVVSSVLDTGCSSAEVVLKPDLPQLPEVVNIEELPLVDSKPPSNFVPTESPLVSMQGPISDSLSTSLVPNVGKPSKEEAGPTSDSFCTSIVPSVGKSSRDERETFVLKAAEAEADAEMEKDYDDGDGWEHEEVPTGISESVSSLTYEEPGSGRSIGGKSDDGGSGSGSLSRLSGLGRAARRQFAAVLDEFWGKLFDLHGQMTQQARSKKLDLALGANVSSNETAGRDIKYSLEQEKRMWKKGNGSEQFCGLDSRTRTSDHLNGVDSPMGISANSAVSASWASQLPLQDSYRQSLPSFCGSERRYSSLRVPSYHEEFDYQPATIHGYKATSYNRQTRGNMFNSHIEAQAGDGSSLISNFRDSLRNFSGASGIDELQTSSFRNSRSESCGLQADRPPYNNSFSGRSIGRFLENGQYTTQTKKYHSLPDISGHGRSQWDPFTGQESGQWHPLVCRATGELDMRYSGLGGSTIARTAFRQSPVSRGGTYNGNFNCQVERVPLSFDELSPSQLHKDAFSLQSTSKIENNSLWSRQPFEQLFGMSGVASGGDHVTERSGKSRILSSPNESLSFADAEVELLQSFRCCIVKLLRLDGSEWLFRQSGGSDEELTDLIAARERFLCDAEVCESYRLYGSDDRKFSSVLKNNEATLARTRVSSVPHCGEGCVWGASLLISFGIWCIHRILELSLMESRPELWGKYTYVLNRLQGILEPAFSRPRPVLAPCFCLQIPLSTDASARKSSSSVSSLSNGSCASSFQSLTHFGRTSSSKVKGTSASVFLEIIKDVEMAVGARKGRTGTAAGDVAFPKGKENLASVLKRYKRRLANKIPGALESGGGNRKVH
eukprot:Gb_17016 [translate_table: standard]